MSITDPIGRSGEQLAIVASGPVNPPPDLENLKVHRIPTPFRLASSSRSRARRRSRRRSMATLLSAATQITASTCTGTSTSRPSLPPLVPHPLSAAADRTDGAR